MFACQNPIDIYAVTKRRHEELLAEVHRERLVDRVERTGDASRQRWFDVAAAVIAKAVLPRFLAVRTAREKGGRPMPSTP
jgi:hypothetical protein